MVLLTNSQLMNTQDKLEFAIGTEIDFYVNELRDDGITDPKVREFVSDVVLPRLTTLRVMVAGYGKETITTKSGKTEVIINGQKHSSQG